ncbi:MAG: carbohydrate-binding family 9-like protein [Gemmatimonadetes bacterium]|jgi:hypothetical protein|nr:carbohydrate-binding family 9-like protein [Gemmatimonadota bacterium]
MVTGRLAALEMRAAALWDADYLYVGFWLEEPDVRATYTERDSMICHENDVEVFIGGKDAYYEFELNALGTIMERFYIRQDACTSPPATTRSPSSTCWGPNSAPWGYLERFPPSPGHALGVLSLALPGSARRSPTCSPSVLTCVASRCPPCPK